MSECRRSVLILVLSVLVQIWGCTDRDPTPPENPGLAARLGADDSAGFARAIKPRRFRFPSDHAPHPEFRNEWWYFTGNLETAGGRRFGYQVTFFRIALTPETTDRRSAWATRDVWMAHVAVSDAQSKIHIAQERLSRGALGLAGAAREPLRLWLEDWEIVHNGAGDWRVRIAADRFTLQFDLSAIRAVVLQGDDGLSQKSAESGNASYYYSIPRLHTTGEITIDTKTYAVSGTTWLDREWSTSALAKDQAGWDWFAVQFSDGRDLMFYRLRRTDGSLDPRSAGTLTASGTMPRRLGSHDIELTPTRWWQSRDGRRYPVAWQLLLPDKKRLRIDAVFDNQHMDLSVSYWEGMVDVYDDSRNGALVGRGYLELAGY